MSARRSRRARQERQERTAQEPVAGRPWSGFSAAEMIRMARQVCTKCEGSRLEWGTVGDLVGRWIDSGEPGDAVRDWFTDFTSSVGVFGQDALQLEAWWCRNCDGFGAFGPLESM